MDKNFIWRIIICIISIIVLFVFFFKGNLENTIFLILGSIPIISIFIINFPRNEKKLEYFNDISDCLRKYFFPAFTLISALIVFVGYNLKTSINEPAIVLIWYVLFFIFYILIIIAPAFFIISKNNKTILGRLFYPLSILLIGYELSALSGGLAGLDFIKSFGWTPSMDKVTFMLFAYIELAIETLLIWLYFKVKNN